MSLRTMSLCRMSLRRMSLRTNVAQPSKHFDLYGSMSMTHLHSVDADVPTFDDLASADGKLERLLALLAGVELKDVKNRIWSAPRLSVQRHSVKRQFLC
jgi:hypothetical protein